MARPCGADLENAGFLECSSVVGVFKHESRDVKLVVHVDDILVSGSASDLKWLQQVLTAEYEIKCKVLGPGFLNSFL